MKLLKPGNICIFKAESILFGREDHHIVEVVLTESFLLRSAVVIYSLTKDGITARIARTDRYDLNYWSILE